ncbi:MAM domain-containing glycosylphosphatidylinositol anchor protein 2 [Turdus rufiventris]|nr:MAM domain-containing glycosylphosphatidylinositol anchor protein 2 [Turdus rufiventris]
MGHSVTLRCTMLKGSPMKVATSVWRFNGSLLAQPLAEQQDYSELKVDSISRETSGSYECSISNDVGVSACLFQVSAKAYSPEFYYDTPNPTLSQKQSKNYSYVLQWTQKEPDAVDPILKYRLEVRQLSQRNTIQTFIPVKKMEKGLLLEHILPNLKVPQSYEVRLTPITSFGAGDMAARIIRYMEPINYPNPTDNTCRFEDEKICGFMQDKMDNFDWTRQNALTQNPKRTVNTGPPTDISGTPEGYYMFIEASRPRVTGDKARLISPLYNISAKYYCVSFYYHMYGKHIGSLNLLVRVRNKRAIDTQVWSLSGNRGNMWQQAHVPINPPGPFQIIFEGVRGTSYEGDIAIDDVTLKKGDCPRKPIGPNKGEENKLFHDVICLTLRLVTFGLMAQVACSQSKVWLQGGQGAGVKKARSMETGLFQENNVENTKHIEDRYLGFQEYSVHKAVRSSPQKENLVLQVPIEGTGEGLDTSSQKPQPGSPKLDLVLQMLSASARQRGQMTEDSTLSLGLQISSSHFRELSIMIIAEDVEAGGDCVAKKKEEQ